MNKVNNMVQGIEIFLLVHGAGLEEDFEIRESELDSETLEEFLPLKARQRRCIDVTRQ